MVFHLNALLLSVVSLGWLEGHHRSGDLSLSLSINHAKSNGEFHCHDSSGTLTSNSSSPNRWQPLCQAAPFDGLLDSRIPVRMDQAEIGLSIGQCYEPLLLYSSPYYYYHCFVPFAYITFLMSCLAICFAVLNLASQKFMLPSNVDIHLWKLSVGSRQ